MPRWLKFSAVGAIGIGVQLAALAFFHKVFGIQCLAATAMAVETAVLHNFLWHQRWTWGDRGQVGEALARLLRFNLSAGLVSIATNVLLMRPTWYASR
jgi:putative flippase GtrA